MGDGAMGDGAMGRWGDGARPLLVNEGEGHTNTTTIVSTPTRRVRDLPTR